MIVTRWFCRPLYRGDRSRPTPRLVNRCGVPSFRVRDPRFPRLQNVPGDRRVKLVALTSRGVKARAMILDAMHAPPMPVLALDRDDLAALHKLLAKIPLSESAPEEPAIDPPPAPNSSARRPPSRAALGTRR
jgi:hypothetical protein